ncbi:hypothetical protein HmCmsJML168_04975 [Escherichia coli]|nr:hypothetical protein HmCmsJML168_04975 [Escherichia coli]GDA92330.1 hypothetical protein HmCmsJML148_04962 [Escherichia coli]GDD89193.1 hypothetical protein HmCmsJML298_04996 [Escherichia coli]
MLVANLFAFQRCQCDFISQALNIVSHVQAADSLSDFFNQFFVGKSSHVLVLIHFNAIFQRDAVPIISPTG